MSSEPPKKSWAQLVATTPPSDKGKPQEPPQQPPVRVAAPQPKVQPKPATTTLPATSSKTAVQPCTFETLNERGYPLGFASQESFDACMQELADAAKEEGIKCAGVGVRGSAATYMSANPHKKGQYFDKRGKGKSDIDAFLVSDSRLDCRPNPSGFFHPDKVASSYPKLDAWGKKWSKELGREISPGVHKSTSPALKEPYIAYGES